MQQDNLVDNVTTLAKKLSHLGQQFSDAALALEGQGELPPDEMLREVEIVRADFEQLRNHALNMATMLGVTVEAEEIRSLAALQPVFRAIADAEHERHEAELISPGGVRDAPERHAAPESRRCPFPVITQLPERSTGTFQ